MRVQVRTFFRNSQFLMNMQPRSKVKERKFFKTSSLIKTKCINIVHLAFKNHYENKLTKLMSFGIN